MNLETIKNLNLFKDELLDLEKLKNQGFNNINYLLKTSNKSYIVRVFKSFDSDYPGASAKMLQAAL